MMIHNTFRWFCTFVLLSLCTGRLAADDNATTVKQAKKTLLAGKGHGELAIEEKEATITIRSGGKPVLVYNKRSPPAPRGIKPIYRRSGFLHPVTSPSGKTVTATFPVDHPHQHGIFSAWVKTTWNGRSINFWDLAGGSGTVLHQRVVKTFHEGDRLGFEVDLIHRAQQPDEVNILRERWKITALPTDGSYYAFDLETTQHALTDKPLIIHKYHYGGMALRGPVKWLLAGDSSRAPVDESKREPSEFLNDKGSNRIKGNHQHARWVSLWGKIDGQPVSITVLCHTENFRAPQAARLHPTKPYFVFAPCVDGEFRIDRDHSLHGRYRYLITDAAPDRKWLNQQWQAWCGAKVRTQ